MPRKDTLMNTKGAAEWMGCTENWIHKLVSTGRLQAHVYDEHGVLAERDPHAKRQGQGLYFYERDLKAYKGKGKGRPAGSKDKKQRVLKSEDKATAEQSQ